MSPGQIVRQPLTLLFLAMTGVFLLLVLTSPELWLRLAAKEGPFEHAGHVALGGSLLLWVALAAKTSGRARVLATLVTLYLAFAFLEEIDWGHVYGADLGHGLIAHLSGGSTNLHNAQKSHASLATWALFWMSFPMALFFGMPLLPSARARSFWQSCAPASSRAIEGVPFFAAALLTLLLDGLPLLRLRLGYEPRAGAGDPIGGPLGWFQIAFYAAWALVAFRALREQVTLSRGDTS